MKLTPGVFFATVLGTVLGCAPASLIQVALDAAMEHTYEGLQQAAFRDVVESVRVLVVDFADEHELLLYEPKNAAGRMFGKLPNDLETQPAIVMYGSLNDIDTRTIFTHEIAHHFIHASMGAVPVWYDEGFAEYLSTADIRDDEIRLGQSPLRNTLSQLPTAEAIVSADRDTFYGAATFGEPDHAAVIRTYYFYAAAWWLVHMIRETRGEAHARFAKVRRAVAEGTPFADAWRTLMVPDGYAQLEDEFQQYQSSPQYVLVRVPFSPVSSGVTPRTRVLSDVELHILMARLVDWRSEVGSRGLEELAAAERLEPDSAEVAYWHGVARLRSGELAAATSLLRSAATKVPNEPRYLHGLGIAELESFTAARSRTAWRLYRSTAKALEALAKSPSELIFSSDFESWSRHFKRAVDLADRALAIDPTCVNCLLVRGNRAAETGDFVGAARFVRRAISALPEGAQDQKLHARLAKYEAAAARAKATEPEPSVATSLATPAPASSSSAQ